MTRRSPWNLVSAGDEVYFKDAGELVTAKALVENVLQFENYSEEELKMILKKYSTQNGILVFLKNAKPIGPFDVDKKGFGNACAWIAVKNISEIKKS